MHFFSFFRENCFIFARIPEEVEAALMVVEDEIRSLNLRKRGAVYESLTKLFLTTNTKTLKVRYSF